MVIGLFGCKQPELENIQQMERSNINIFGDLPETPTDFIIIQREVYSGTYPNLCMLSEGYYMRPEFYPTWERDKVSIYDNHDYSRWGVYGYGAYPSEMGINIRNMKENESFTLCTFFKTALGIETYQGVVIKPVENEYFKVTTDPSIMLLEPTFPIINKNWVKKVFVTVTAKTDVPEGKYKLGFTITAPSEEMSKEFTWQVLEKEIRYDEEYRKKCDSSVKERRISEDCEKIYMLRQNKYVSGGTWNIEGLTYSLEVNVVS
jgi:hypothetical protein